ncbi:MAG: ATP-binding cassette domain-containing protein, partial [Bacteroidota bacterium]
MSTPDPVLQIHQLSAVFGKGENKTYAVKELSFQVKAGQTLGIVGESGSGKSMTALSIMGLLPKAGTLESGELVLRRGTEEIDLRRASERQMQGIRGKSMGMIFQEPMTSLNPVHRCGDQVAEVLRLHQNLSKGDAKTLTLDWFRKVQLPRVEELYRSYPHQLSGGQKQRVMIAMA